MKKSRNPLIAILLGIIFLSPACSLASETPQTPLIVRSSTPSPLPTASPLPTSPTVTPTPSPTTAPAPTSFSTASPIPPTSTMAPFLPADLVPVNPQNASNLKPVAVLSQKGASMVTFSPDSQWMATGLFTTNHILIWDLASGQEHFNLSGHVDPRIISYLAFSPDGSQLASAAQGWDAPNDSLILWDAATGRELQRFSGVLGAVSPDWRLVALTRREQNRRTTLTLSDLANGAELHTLQAPGDIYGVSFSPQGQQVAAKMYNVFQDLFAFWSVDNGRLDRTLYDWIGFSFSPDGRFIAALLESSSGSDVGEINIFDGTTFKWMKNVAKGADALWFTYPAFTPDGNILAASFGDHVILWDTQTWQELTTLPVFGPATLAFSPDGCLLITSSQSGKVQIWAAVGQ